MRGLILAAGRGTRLKPLTESRSKALVLLANRPLIHYAIDKLLDIGIEDIGVVVGDNEGQLRSVLDPRSANFTYIRQGEAAGIAHAVSCAREFTGDSEFILLFCDNVYSSSLRLSLQQWRQLRGDLSGRCQCLLHVHTVDDPRNCGVVVVDSDGWVTELEEKPQQPRSDLAIAGVYYFTPKIHSAIERISPSARGELEITDAIGTLLADGCGVHAYEPGGFWYDTGTFAHILAAQASVMDAQQYENEAEACKSRISGNAGLPPDCVVESCTIEGPVLAAAQCLLRGSRIGPNVALGQGSSVNGCELSDCILYPGTQLDGVQARGAIFDGTTRIDVS
jgi:glucose-1-phosphate thymidylyltransferase